MITDREKKFMEAAMRHTAKIISMGHHPREADPKRDLEMWLSKTIVGVCTVEEYLSWEADQT